MIKTSHLNLGLLGLLLCGAMWAFIFEQSYYINLISRVTIFAIAGIGLNIALGYGGMVSLGHAAFFGLGGYVAGIGAHHAMLDTNFAFSLSGSNEMLILWFIAALLSIMLSLIIGLLSIRTTGVYFIMITLAFAQMIYYFAISWSDYGGEDGLLISSRNQFLGLDTDNEMFFFMISFSVLVLLLFISARLIRSRFGAALAVARMNPVRLATVGIHPFPIKLVAFIISAIITTIAGALFADLNRFVSPDMLSWQMSGELIIFILLGGVGRLFGPVMGALFFVMLETIIGGYTEHWKIFLGLILLCIVLFTKGGVMQLIIRDKQHEH